MEIPDKVKIGGIEYTVKRSTRHWGNDVNVDGEIIYDRGIIKLREDSEQSKDYKDIVFIRAVMYGIFHHMCVDKGDGTLIEVISQGLHEVIRDNQNIFTERSVGGFKTLGEQAMQAMLPHFAKYNLCRNRETGKVFVYKSRRMDPIYIDIISVEDIFDRYTVGHTEFKEDYEVECTGSSIDEIVEQVGIKLKEAFGNIKN